MRCDHEIRAFCSDLSANFFNWHGGKLLIGPIAIRTGLCDFGMRWSDTLIENLRPSVAEPPIPDNENILIVGKLSGDRFHSKGAAPGNKNTSRCVVDRRETIMQTAHHVLKCSRHVVHRTISEHD